jgi:hypothetical protein
MMFIAVFLFSLVCAYNKNCNERVKLLIEDSSSDDEYLFIDKCECPLGPRYNYKQIISEKDNIPELEGCNFDVSDNFVPVELSIAGRLLGRFDGSPFLEYDYDGAYKAIYSCCKRNSNTNIVPVPKCSPREITLFDVFVFIVVVLLIISFMKLIS